MRTRHWLALLALLFAAAAAPLQSFETASLTIVAKGGDHRFTVELAVTPAQLEQGLMYRTEMAPDHGMLFDFGQPTMATMWMRNTAIPLDMLFVDTTGRIVNIAERTIPESDAIVSAAAPVRAVIELNGGTAARLGITPGDQVRYRIFGTGP